VQLLLPVPAEVKDSLRHFLLTSVGTTDALALYTFLGRHLGESSTLDEMVLATGLGREEARLALSHLVKTGLVAESESVAAERRYQYAPQEAEVRHLSDDLRRLYDENPAAVLRVLTEGAVERLLYLARQAFSSGFAGRKRDGE
jgi:hypothetical protein